LQGRFYLGVAIIMVVVFSHPLLMRSKAGPTEHREPGL